MLNPGAKCYAYAYALTYETTVLGTSKYSTSSYSIPRQLHSRLKAALPKHGDRSKLVTRMIEMWLDKEIVVTVPKESSSYINLEPGPRGD